MTRQAQPPWKAKAQALHNQANPRRDLDTLQQAVADEVAKVVPEIAKALEKVMGEHSEAVQNAVTEALRGLVVPTAYSAPAKPKDADPVFVPQNVVPANALKVKASESNQQGEALQDAAIALKAAKPKQRRNKGGQ